MSSTHIIMAPSMKLRCCHCSESASKFILCRRCKKIVATCGGHKLSIEQERDAHCKAAP